MPAQVILIGAWAGPRKLSRCNEWEDSHMTIFTVYGNVHVACVNYYLNRKLAGFSNVRGVGALKKYAAMRM